ncbi:hypothetical protein BH10BAC4_BH10BAC4_01340 [soil metagenome]
MVRLLIPYIFSLLFLLLSTHAFSQDKLYTARGYWEESTNSTYRAIQKKKEKGDSLTQNEKNYVVDYEKFLSSYYQRLPEDEKENYGRLKNLWDSGQVAAPSNAAEVKDFEWKGRDRLANGLYGLWYGASVVSITETKGAATLGIPLITSGLWMLGPVINPNKYKSITRNTLRASNTGKLLGLGYGAALGVAIAGGTENAGKWSFGLSTLGSIILGETAFHAQERNNYTAGRIEMMRHYGFLGPWVGFAAVVSAGSDNAQAAGVFLLAGGVSGLLIGSRVAKRYDYTRGDVDAISSLTLITTGLGFTAISGSYQFSGGDRKSLIIVPAITSIAGTIWAQRAVRGARLTDKQGSVINLATAGAALVGLGAVSLTESHSPAVYFGVPSGLALITHQLLFHKYKMNNALNLRGSRNRKSNYQVSFKLTPESYFLNKQIAFGEYSPQVVSKLHNPIFKLTVKF